MKYAPFQKNMDLMKAAMAGKTFSFESAVAKDSYVAPVSSSVSTSGSSQSWGKSPNGASRSQSVSTWSSQASVQSSSRYVIQW